jgi:hypothetical protein
MLMEKLEEWRNNFKQKTSTEKMQIVGLIVLRGLAMIIALFLSWTCNANFGLLMRILVSVISAVFAEIYIVYYMVYHILMGVKCASGVSAETATLASSLIKSEKRVESQSGFPFKQKASFSDFFKSLKNTV